jgi:predicted DNA binding CopG/RHH family protein
MAYKLDPEEKEILKLFEQNKLKKVKNLKKEIVHAEKAATEHMKKNARITIRISEFDLAGLKRKAALEGIPYQTLISSILHKYLST